MKDHKLIDSNERKYKCNECNKRFTLLSYLKTHHFIHSNERQFVCDWSQCGKSFKTKPSLKDHKRRVHLNERKFKCDYNNCEKRFFLKSHLNIHKSTHFNERKYKCNECNKYFTQLSHLKTHRLIHSKKIQYVCDWSQCRKRFKIKSYLNSDKQFVDLKERKFECNECQNKFYTKVILENHKPSHSGEKPFVCDHKNCDKSFTHKHHLKTHIKIHYK